MSTLRRAAARDIVLLVIAVVLLGLAVFVFRSCSGGESAPTDESSWTYYVCESCDEYFHLNGAELEETMESGRIASAPDGRSILFACKNCEEVKAVRAGKCPEHGEVIKLNPGDGDPKSCSQCGYRP